MKLYRHENLKSYRVTLVFVYILKGHDLRYKNESCIIQVLGPFSFA
jgi:hypothetical protein